MTRTLFTLSVFLLRVNRSSETCLRILKINNFLPQPIIVINIASVQRFSIVSAKNCTTHPKTETIDAFLVLWVDYGKFCNITWLCTCSYFSERPKYNERPQLPYITNNLKIVLNCSFFFHHENMVREIIPFIILNIQLKIS